MRSKRATIRTIQVDSKYKSERVAHLISYVMRDGKKSVAERQVYLALSALEAETKKPALEALDAVVEMVAPQMEVRSRRVGGAAYQVPMPVRPQRAQALALRWLVQEARKRPNGQYHTFAEKLVAEMMDALNNQGGAIARKQNSHRMADANKAFAHFRW